VLSWPRMDDRKLPVDQPHPREMVDQIRYYAGQRTRGVELHRFLLRHGREYINPYWRPILKARPKACFENAATTALAHKDLYYAEGFGWSNEVPILFEHAWCVDGSGLPVEVTLRSGVHTDLRSFGVALLRGFIENLLKEGATLPCLERDRLADLDALTQDQWRHPINDVPVGPRG
jgi:hypothetical protein